MASANHRDSSPLADLQLSKHGQTPFVGRRKERSKVMKAFMSTLQTNTETSGVCKMCVVSGCHLVGKTRFVKETAAHLKDSCRSLDIQLSIHFLELGGLEDPQLVTLKMMSSLVPSQCNVAQNLADSLASLETWHLFILDGADGFAKNEHQNAFCKVCQDVVEGSSRVLLMITSRWMFGFIRIMNKVLHICLDPLEPDESRQLLISKATKKIRAEVEDGSTDADLEEVIRHCGGMPFALELAGADLQEGRKSAAEIVAELQSRHTTNQGSIDCDATDRAECTSSGKVRRIMEPLIGGAVDSLPPGLRKHLAEMAFIPSSFTVDAAAHITNINPTAATKRDLLLPLHVRSLIAVDTLTSRFNFLSFLRLYIEERYHLLLSPKETCLIRGRYCGFYARLLQRAAELLDQGDACNSLPIFSVELLNIQKLLQVYDHFNCK